MQGRNEKTVRIWDRESLSWPAPRDQFRTIPRDLIRRLVQQTSLELAPATGGLGCGQGLLEGRPLVPPHVELVEAVVVQEVLAEMRKGTRSELASPQGGRRYPRTRRSRPCLECGIARRPRHTYVTACTYDMLHMATCRCGSYVMMKLTSMFANTFTVHLDGMRSYIMPCYPA